MNQRIHGEDEVKASVHLFGEENERGFRTVWTVRANHVKQVKAKSILVGCMDHRFQRCERLLITEQMNIGAFDHIRVPGPDLVFANGAGTPVAAMVQTWIDKSIELHDPDGIVLVGHWNCGGHPGYGSCDEEEYGHERAISESLDYLSCRYPDLLLTGMYSRLVGNQLVFRKKKIIPASMQVNASGNGHVVVTA